VTGNYYPRDIGRSSELSNGTILLQFGDTFCHNRDGKFVGLTDNTCAMLVNTLCPTLSTYAFKEGKEGDETDENQSLANSKQFGTAYGNTQIPSFIHRFKDEEDTADSIFKFWSFSGIVEYSAESSVIYGWAWFQKWAITPDATDQTLVYTGIAQIVYQHSKNPPTIRTHRHTERNRRALFTNQEPQFGKWNNLVKTHDFQSFTAVERLLIRCLGSVCAVSHREFIYVYGHIQSQGQAANRAKDVVLARVPLASAHLREKYEFWNGSWNGTATTCSVVLQDMQHGQIFKTDMFR
jgi:hypothetical protein